MATLGEQLIAASTAGAKAPQPGYGVGYGGTDYNALDSSGKQQMQTNDQRAQTDPNYRLSELARANTVTANRTAQGLDTGAQKDYINRLNAYAKAGSDANGTAGTDNGAGNGVGTNNNPNNSSLIKSIYDSMYASQAQKLKDTRDQQLAGLAGQDTLAQNNAQSALNANDVSGARLANQLREHMANLGLLQGGDYISQQVGQNAAQGQNANQINMDLGNRLSQLAAQKDAINHNASADDLALLQNIQSQQGQSQLSDAYKQQDYGLNLARESGQLPGGGQSLAGKAQSYAQDPNNPANIGLGLTNQLNQLKLNEYPAQAKAAAEQVQQQLQAGQITNQEAQLKLDQLKDPNSLTNQKLKADVDLTKSQSEYYKDHGQYFAGGGSQSGANSANATAKNNSYTGSVYDQLSQLKPEDYAGYLTANQGEIVKNIGQKAFDDFKKSVMADQNTQSKADSAQGKVDLTIREKAIAAAQKDPDFLTGKAKLKDLIPQYEELYK